METALRFVPPTGHRACSSCHDSKTKCIRLEVKEDVQCERCRRLGKDCEVQKRVKKRRRQDDARLTSQSLGASVCGTAAAPGKADDVPGVGFLAEVAAAASSASASSSLSRPPVTSFPFPGFNIGDDEAEELLLHYLNHFHHWDLYMTIPPTTTAAELRRQKPMLWLGIMFATYYHDYEKRTAMASGAVAYLGEQVFQRGRKGLDLLQGLIVFINWFCTQAYALPQLTNLFHMVMAIAVDHGFVRSGVSSGTTSDSPLGHYVAGTFHGSLLASQEARAPGLDDRRALAGCFYLTSALSGTVNTLAPLPYSAQLEETCQFFEQFDPRSADFKLAKAVRLQHLINRVDQLRKDSELLPAAHHRIPFATHITAFLRELAGVWEGLPAEVCMHVPLLLLYHTAEIHIYKLSLTEPSCFSNSASSFSSGEPSTANSPPPSSTTPPARDRSSSSSQDQEDMQLNCLLALKSWYDIFFTIAPSTYHYMPITVFAQLVSADMSFARLTAFWCGKRPADSPAEFPPFGELMERLARNFDAAQEAAHPLGREMRTEIFAMFARRVRSFKGLDSAVRLPTPAQGTGSVTPSGSASVSGLGVAQQRERRQQQEQQRQPSPGGLDSPMMHNHGPPMSLENEMAAEPTQDEWWSWFSQFEATVIHGGLDAQGQANGQGQAQDLAWQNNSVDAWDFQGDPGL